MGLWCPVRALRVALVGFDLGVCFALLLVADSWRAGGRRVANSKVSELEINSTWKVGTLKRMSLEL